MARSHGRLVQGEDLQPKGRWLEFCKECNKASDYIEEKKRNKSGHLGRTKKV